MRMTRRRALGLSLGAAASGVAGIGAGTARASPDEAAAKIREIAGGREPRTGRVRLTLPDVAEDGNTVPASVSVDSAMTADDMVESVTILADDNPYVETVTFRFTELSGEASVSTRIRLARTQNVIALARMKDGSVFVDRKRIEVVVGGCGSEG